MGHHYDDNLGALLIGQMISTFLYGISTLQTYVYMIRFPRDSPELKIWVLAVWLLDSVNVVLVCHGLYYWAWGMVGSMPGQGSTANHESWAKRSFFISAVLNLTVAAVVQSFFIRRIYRLCQTRFARYTVPSVLTVFVLGHLALGAWATVKVIFSFQSTSLDSLSRIAYTAALPYTLLALLSDAMIAGTLIQLSRGRTPEWDSPRMQTMTMQFVTFAINRCVLVTVAAFIRLVAFTILPWTAWFITVDFIMGKLYANSFMACLNARSFFPTPEVSRGDSAIFSSVPDISVRSNGSVLPHSYSPMPPRRPASRAVSLPDMVFCKNKYKGSIPGPSAGPERDICPCLLDTR
ncbi:hypothetical protein C8Q79DRAFT_948710 [Trametes meyenii]|nr:hypothetical protein C8Q79DRAFT_948710 [Trametes meyenii]